MKSRYVNCFSLLLLINFLSCTFNNQEEEFLEHYSKIKLRWVKGYPDETKKQVTTGLYWGLSQLGAKLPKSDSSDLIQWISKDLFYLNLNFAGFSSEAITELSKLNKVLIHSNEYDKMNGIDIGRYIMLTINSSYHYFKITRVPKNFTEFRNKYPFNYKKAHVNNSSIAFDDRIIDISEASQYDEIAYAATEGFGEIGLGNFSIEEYETIDVMENGQIRFGLYDINGDLKATANSNLTNAGKPSKCMWCHESGIQRFFSAQPLYEEAMTLSEFLTIRENYHELIDEQREFVDGLIFYENLKDHTLMELLYISFNEPSIRRLSIEWQMTKSDIEAMLSNEVTHENSEFEFLGSELYWRNDIEKYSPFDFVRTPTETREESVYEPDLIE